MTKKVLLKMEDLSQSMPEIMLHAPRIQQTLVLNIKYNTGGKKRDEN